MNGRERRGKPIRLLAVNRELVDAEGQIPHIDLSETQIVQTWTMVGVRW